MPYKLPPGLVATVADSLELSSAKARGTIEAVLDALVDELHLHNKVTIGGFGSLLIRDRPALTARNPKTGEAVPVPARRRVAFAAAKTLHEQYN